MEAMKKYQMFAMALNQVMGSKDGPKTLKGLSTELKEGLKHYDMNGFSAICFALCCNKPDLLKSLIENGCPVNAPKDVMFLKKTHPIHQLILQTQDDSLTASLIQKLIDECKSQKVTLNIDEQNIYGENSLMYSSTMGLLKTTKVLINNGANINIYAKGGETPLSFAKREKQKDVIDFLTSKGAKEFDVKDLKIEVVKINNIPDHFSDGYLDENFSHRVEQEFGGIMTKGGVSAVFCSHKEPMVGLGFQLKVNFKKPTYGKEFTWYRGFITEIEKEGRILRGTVTINPDHEDIKELQGEYDIKLEFDATRSFPYVLTDFGILKDDSKSYLKIMTFANKEFHIHKKGGCSHGHDHDHDHHHHDHDHHDHDHHHDHDDEEEFDGDEEEHEHDENCKHDHHHHH